MGDWHGFRFRVEDVTRDMRLAKWMQCYYLYDRGRPNFVPDLKRVLRRALVTDHNIDDTAIRRSWLSAVGIGGLVSWGHVPVLRALYLSCLLSSKGATPMALRRWNVEDMDASVLAVIRRERQLDELEPDSQKCGMPSLLKAGERIARYKAFYVDCDARFAVDYCGVNGVTPSEAYALEDYLLSVDMDEVESKECGEYSIRTRHLAHLNLS